MAGLGCRRPLRSRNAALITFADLVTGETSYAFSDNGDGVDNVGFGIKVAMSADPPGPSAPVCLCR